MSSDNRQGEPGEDESRLVVYQSADREGSTFSLSPTTRRVLKQKFGEAVHPAPRVFIAHETNEDYHRLHGDLWKQIVLLLTGLREDLLSKIGTVEFRDPVTDQPL